MKARDSSARRTRPDNMTLFFIALAAVSAATLWWRDGAEQTLAAIADAATLMLFIAPVITAALLIGGYVQEILPHDTVARWLSENGGATGFLLAMLAGVVTPAGPFVAFPLVLALRRSGAPFDICVVYITAWATLGIHRIVIWELPFLGHDFVALRVASSLILPIAGGLLARSLAGQRL